MKIANVKEKNKSRSFDRIVLFFLTLCMIIFGPRLDLHVGQTGAVSVEAASWKLTNGKVTNGKTVYRTNSTSFYSCDTKGKNKKIIYKAGASSGLTNPKITYLYKGKIYIEYFYCYETMFGKYEGKMMIYDIAKKKLTRISKPFHILGKSGVYMLGCGVINAGAGQGGMSEIADPVYVYNMNTGKIKTLTKYGLEAKVSGNYFYYVSYSNKKASIVRCTRSGGSKKVLKKITWKNYYDIEKLTSHSMTYWTNNEKKVTVRF